jgi:hypothetical protein
MFPSTKHLVYFLMVIAIHSVHAIGGIISNESFEGKVVGSLDGQSGGVGWAGNWSARTGVNVSAGGLNYSKGSVTVLGGDRKLSLNSPADGLALSRQFAQPATGTTYMSMLFQASSIPDRNQDRILMLINNDLNSEISSGFRMSTSDSANRGFVTGHVILGNGFAYNSNDGGIIPGETNLLVARLSVAAVDTERLDFWFNPNSVDEASNASFSVGTTALSAFNRSFLTIGTFGLNANGPDEYFIDEIKIGSSWSDVVAVPEPSSIVLVALASTVGLRAVRRSRVRRFKAPSGV